MKALEMIEKWDVDENHNQRDNISVLKKYITRQHSKRPFVIKLETGDRGLEESKIKFENIYEFERTITENTILIEKPENETDQRNYLSMMMYRNPSLLE